MKIIQSSLSAKNQTVIPSPIRKQLNLKPGDKIIWKMVYTNKNPQVVAEPQPKSWTNYTRGLGQNIWQNIDIKSYVKNLKKEWAI